MGKRSVGSILVVTVAVALGVVVFVAVHGGGDPAAEPPIPVCERPFANGEWGADTVVVASLSTPPAVGTTATLTVQACAKRAGQLKITIELPDSFDWSPAPAGTTVTQRVSPNPANFGCLDVASGTWPVSALQPLSLTGTVAAHATGFATLTATAFLTGPQESTQGNADNVFVTVGATSSSSYFGSRPEDLDTRSTNTPATPPTPSCP